MIAKELSSTHFRQIWSVEPFAAIVIARLLLLADMCVQTSRVERMQF